MTTRDPDGGTDDRRAMPPADPWLDAAPTSRIDSGGADHHTVLDAPLATPFAAPFAVPDDRPPRRGRWFAVAAALALLACLGGVLLNPFDDDKPTDRANRPPAGTDLPTTNLPATNLPATDIPATTAATTAVAPAGNAALPTSASAAAPAVEVVYQLSSRGRGEVASVQFTDQDRDIVRLGEVSLPWRHTFRITGDKPPLVVVAQRKQGGVGEMTCSISLGGKVLATAVQRGRYAAPQCAA